MNNVAEGQVVLVISQAALAVENLAPVSRFYLLSMDGIQERLDGD